MTAKIVPRATLNEVLAFLKARGISLSDDGRKLLAKMMDENPIGKPTLERSKFLVKNPLMKEILDSALVYRSNRKQRIAENNPLIKAIDEKRKNTLPDTPDPHIPMPESLRSVFYDEPRWQPFFPFLSIPPEGKIIKVQELTSPARPYIGFIHPEGGGNYLYTTRRKIDAAQLPEAKFYRLRDGVFQYEIDEVKNHEQGYYDYIMMFHSK